MTLTIKNDKGEFTVSLEDFAEKFGSYLPAKMGIGGVNEHARKDLLDFLQSYDDVN